jgi:DNA gyrase subunit A
MSQDFDQNDTQNNTLPGQMSYDQLTPIEQPEQEQTDNNIVLQGQMDIFEHQQNVLKQQEKVSDMSKQQSKNQPVENKKLPKAKKSQTEQQDKSLVIYRSLDEVLHDSMIPYTEHVVLDRALPRVEDGLKPVQRRILYSMLELGLEPDKPYRKSARIVGDCMGKYHPHGDSSVYDAMVRMAQDFSLREPLVKGHGNFGSIDGDTAAAMRYTEAKLTPLAMELLRDLEKNTVKWSFNFDDTLKEPDMLPGRFPNLLVNGASGIAVGVATNIPPHNLAEVIDGVVEYIDNNKITLEQIMQHIKGPDFPTGGIVVANDLKEAYQTGRGKVIIRAKVEIENDSDKKQLVITELPYQVNKAALLARIAELRTKEKDKLSVITEIRDESDRHGMRAVIKLKKEANEHAILEYLYKSTQLQVTFGINMVAIADGRPKQLGLLEIIAYYTEYQRQVVLARTKYDLEVAKDRAHIVEGLLIAIANIDEVVKIIKSSDSVATAKQSLRARFNLSEKQAQAILDMRLARLVNLETVKLEQELKELQALIKKLEAIVNSKRMQFNVVKTELLNIKKQHKNARKSQIVSHEEIKTNIEAAMIEEAFAREVVVGVTAAGTIKQIPIKNYSLAQKQLTGSSSLFDVHTILAKAMTNQTLLFVTNKGNCAKVQVNSIPEAKWRDQGVMLIDIVKGAAIDEKVIAIFDLPTEPGQQKMYFYTKLGYVKSALFADCIIAKNFYSITNLKEGDQLIGAELENAGKTIVMVTQNGIGINFDKSEVPCQGRNASGVFGINLDQDDFVIEAKQAVIKGSVTIVAENGYAKKMPIGELNVLSRYRKGQAVIKFEDNCKKLVYAAYGEVACDVVLAKGEKLTFVGARAISFDGRSSKGKQVAKGKFTAGYTYLV